ncbi:MAG: hypothetical protein GXZ08_02985 [Tissierellia bacterium]|nr:hypothetical protein [Tissierellia bacterium]
MIKYYYIIDLKMIGKIENYVPFVYKNEIGWVVDNENILMDRIMGYDFDDIGDSETQEKVQNITKEKAQSFFKEEVY